MSAEKESENPPRMIEVAVLMMKMLQNAHGENDKNFIVGNGSPSQRDGQEGVITWQYTGMAAMGKKVGPGKITWSDGAKFKGFFIDDLADGNCSFILANGAKYEGGVVAGRFEGLQSKFHLSIGSDYTGDFRDGTMRGQGKYIWPDGKSYEGNWENGIQKGHGIKIYANTGGTVLILFIASSMNSYQTKKDVNMWEIGKTVRRTDTECTRARMARLLLASGRTLIGTVRVCIRMLVGSFISVLGKCTKDMVTARSAGRTKGSSLGTSLQTKRAEPDSFIPCRQKTLQILRRLLMMRMSV